MSINIFLEYFNFFSFVIGDNPFFSKDDASSISSITATISVLVAIGAIIISSYTVRSQKKQNQFNNLLKVFELLNKEDRRKARKEIYRAYLNFQNKYKNKKDKPDDLLNDRDVKDRESLQHNIEIIRADFDQIGSMSENKLFSDNAYFASAWDPTLRCWECLELHIQKQRRIRKAPYYMTYFERLAKKAEKYRIKKKYPKITFFDDTTNKEID